MAQQTQAQRKAAAKKGAATRQRKAAQKSGADAKRSATSLGKQAVSTAGSIGAALVQGAKAVVGRVGAARKRR